MDMVVALPSQPELEVVADEQPADVGGVVVGRRLPEQPARADLEQFGGEVGVREAMVDSGAERRAGRRFAVELVGQDAVAAQQVEQLARHHGAERGDAAVLDLDPLVVRSRMADERTRRQRSVADGPENLHLLAAHHVGERGIEMRQARDDRDASRLDPDEVRRQIVERGGAAHIGRLDPAAVRPDHARHQHQPVEAERGLQLGERGFEADARGGDLENAETVLMLALHRAAVDDIAATVGGAPVDGEKGRHQCDSRVTTPPDRPRRKERSAPSFACITVST